MRIFVLVACSLLLLAAPALADRDDEGFVRVRPEEINWRPVPDGHGAQMAVIYGDPGKPGVYIIRVKFPPHVMDKPHFHPEDRLVTVLKGTWYTGTGARFDPEQTVPLKPGSFMMHPGKMLHWDGSKSDEEVIVQVVGNGPSATTLMSPNEPMWVEVK